MDIYEITGFKSGVDRAGVNFLEPADSFQDITNGYIYRQELLSRKGFSPFANRLSDGSRVMGIFEHILPDDSKVLLACSQEFLYRYNEISNAFDQIPNNSAAPFISFGILAKEDYVSGTSYPTATGTQRFVFTSRGMSDIYFYDGTDVKRFTNTTDNPNYQAPAAGALNRATYVLWFGERLNFFLPVIAGQVNSQMVLYSGIRTASGNGDKFNVSGSGNLSADTYEYMTGAVIAGDYLVLNFNRSNWTLEKTRDPFNPYFIRKVPSVLGTDASFSAVSWDNKTQSIGRTGIVHTDGKQSLRSDNKIPYFTADAIDPSNFDMTYGGFDRITSQFLFAYRSSLSTLIPVTQDSVLVNNYKENTWANYSMRFTCFGQTDKGQDLAWDDIYEVNNPSWASWDETEETWNKIGIGSGVQKTLAGDDLGFIYEINADYDDYFVDITGITQASEAVVTVEPCALQIGDVVSFANVGGMVDINGIKAIIQDIGVTNRATTSITVNILSSTFPAYTSGGSVSKVIAFYAETLPFNPYRAEGLRCYVSHVEFLLNTNNGNLLIDIYSDEEESPFKKDILVQPVGYLKAREWITISVNQEANFLTFALKQESADSQVVVTSIRIHCSRGGLTSA